MKDHDLDPLESGENNPYRVLIHKLTGVSHQKPRLRSATNTWGKTQKEFIDAEIKKTGAIVGRNHLVAARDKMARSLFLKLPKAEQEVWEKQAKEDHQEQVEKWKNDLASPPSTQPADRQRYLLLTIVSSFSDGFLGA